MSEHYYTEKPLSKEEITKIEINIKKDSFELYTATGLFSKQELDKATKLLIENVEIKGKKILDLGCGYGVIGISILRKNPDVQVTFTDINERAIKITKKNLEKHKLKGKIIKSNLYENIQDTFDVILSNPPMAAGRETCYELIEKAHKYLNKCGTLQIVARHTKGGKTLSKKMDDVFGEHEVLAKQGGFRIYKAIKN